MAHVQAAAAMEAAHEQQLASHSGLLDSALDVTATVEARFGMQTNPSLILSTFIVTVVSEVQRGQSYAAACRPAPRRGGRMG